jgi:hypothetical protein
MRLTEANLKLKRSGSSLLLASSSACHPWSQRTSSKQLLRHVHGSQVSKDVVLRKAQHIPTDAGHTPVQGCALGVRPPIRQLVHAPHVLVHEVIDVLFW